MKEDYEFDDLVQMISEVAEIVEDLVEKIEEVAQLVEVAEQIAEVGKEKESPVGNSVFEVEFVSEELRDLLGISEQTKYMTPLIKSYSNNIDILYVPHRVYLMVCVG